MDEKISLNKFNLWHQLNPQVKGKETFYTAYKFFLEEFDELYETVTDNGDSPINVTSKLLDDLGDSLFTLIQLFKWLDIPVEKVLDRICESNLTKFTTCKPCITDEANKHGYHVIEKSVGDKIYYAMVDDNGKIKKPTWFENVKLDDLC